MQHADMRQPRHRAPRPRLRLHSPFSSFSTLAVITNLSVSFSKLLAISRFILHITGPFIRSYSLLDFYLSRILTTTAPAFSLAFVLRLLPYISEHPAQYTQRNRTHAIRGHPQLLLVPSFTAPAQPEAHSKTAVFLRALRSRLAALSIIQVISITQL